MYSFGDTKISDGISYPANTQRRRNFVTTSLQRRVAATSRRCSDVVTTLLKHCVFAGYTCQSKYFGQIRYKFKSCPVNILYKSIAGHYRPVRVADGPVTARYRFIKNASWVLTLCSDIDFKDAIRNKPKSFHQLFVCREHYNIAIRICKSNQSYVG